MNTLKAIWAWAVAFDAAHPRLTIFIGALALGVFVGAVFL